MNIDPKAALLIMQGIAEVRSVAPDQDVVRYEDLKDLETALTQDELTGMFKSGSVEITFNQSIKDDLIVVKVKQVEVIEGEKWEVIDHLYFNFDGSVAELQCKK